MLYLLASSHFDIVDKTWLKKYVSVSSVQTEKYEKKAT